jgi:hypothetical protein
MDFASQLVPAIVLLAANLMSGRHGSLRWERVTAIFGWMTGAELIVFLTVSAFASNSALKGYLFQVAAFSLLTAMSRDYEKLLRPLFRWNH